MIDDQELERVSRYLDDDLGADERFQLEGRIRHDPELKALVDELADLRSAVRRSADEMHPPAELDALLEPLRRSRPHTDGMRPAYRVLAAAAVVIVAVTLGLQVAKNSPTASQEGAGAPPRSHPPLGGGEVFQLQPLPTASTEDREMVGASDHLLAQPPPDPTVDEPQPLHIMGPLDEPPEVAEETVPATSVDSEADSEPAAVRRSQENQPYAFEDGVADQQPTRPRSAAKSAASRGFAAAPQDVAPSRSQRTARVKVGGVSVGCEPCRELADGHGELVVVIGDGRVSDCRTAAGDGAWNDGVCAALIGLEVNELADGSYPATVDVTESTEVP